MVERAKDAGIVRVVRDAKRTAQGAQGAQAGQQADPNMPSNEALAINQGRSQSRGIPYGTAQGNFQGNNQGVPPANYPGTYGSYGGSYQGGMFGEANPFPQQDDVQEIFRKLWRRKWLILATILLSTLLAIGLMSLLPRKYSSFAALFVDSSNNQILTSSQGPQVAEKDEVYIVSQTDIIRSRGFAEDIIRQLGLARLPEFNKELRDDNVLDTAWKFVLEKAGGEGETTFVPNSAGDNRIPATVVDKFMSQLFVTHKNETRIIEIHFTSKNPQLARDVPNALADLYIQWQREQRFNDQNRIGRALAPKIAALEEEVKRGEAEIVELTQRIGGIEGSDGKQLGELTSKLLSAEAELAELKSRRDNAPSSDLLGSPLVDRLRGEQATLLQRKADLSSEYGAKHPVMAQLNAQIADVNTQIEGETKKVRRGLQSNVNVAQAKVSALRNARTELETKLQSGSGELPILKSLERQVDSDRSLLANMVQQYKLAITNDKSMIESDTKTVSLAAVPEKASSPKPGLILPVVLMASLILGLIFAFLREKLEPGYLSGQQIEKEFGVPVLALVPATSKFLGGEPDVLQELRSPFTESMRTIGTSIRLFDIDNPPKVVLLTSAEPSEGKSTIAISVARVQALAGLKVIIVDTDIRKPVVHERLSVRRAPGLVEVLDGKHTLEEAIVSDEKTGVDVLPVGVPVSTDTLAFDRMRDFLSELREYYDLIIIDSAPILAVSDARILPAIADMTVFTVRWQETRREVVRLAIKQLQESGARLGGIVLSRVNVKRHSRYGYGDSSLYTGKLKKYYTQNS